MPRLRIALAQINSTVGDLEGNSAAIIEWTRRAADRGARLVVFPEMMLTGYPVEDLALRASFIDASIEALSATAARLAERGSAASRSSPGTSAATPARRRGTASRPRARWTRRRCCTAARCWSPRPSTTCPTTACSTSTATSCPATGCRCSASRAGSPGRRSPPWTWPSPSARTCGRTAARWPSPGRPAAGCWSSPTPPPTSAARTTRGWSCAQRRAREAGATLAYVNMVGGQDELVFDGDSIIVDADGRLLARGPQFEEALVVADLDLPRPAPEPCRWTRPPTRTTARR